MRADAQSRSRRGTRGGDRLGGCHAGARARLRDARRTRSESVQHLRGAAPRRTPPVDAARAGHPDDLQAAGAFVHCGARGFLAVRAALNLSYGVVQICPKSPIGVVVSSVPTYGLSIIV